MKKVVVSAPGKIHLSGLHAVVAGKPAILTSTSRRLFITLSTTEDKGMKKIEKLRKENEYFNAIVTTFEREHKVEVTDIFVKIDSNIPISKGMGSSAALAVATIGALRELYRKPWDVKALNETAFEAEKARHVTPSGGDNTIASFGGLLWYRKEFDFLKTFWLLPFKIPKTFSQFVLINTGRKEGSGELITHVVKQDMAFKEPIFNFMETAAKIMTMGIKEEKEEEFRKGIKMNQDSLEKLGVVSDDVKKMIRKIEKLGGVAKITGAGGWKNGSGVVLAVHSKPQEVIELARKLGYDTFQVELSGEGVKREQVVV